jgi:hypothetical protein
MPPYLAGRTEEQDAFRKLLGQTVVTDNLVITGLRGVGKTVLLAELKPIALQSGWLWAGDDFSAHASLSEERIAGAYRITHAYTEARERAHILKSYVPAIVS